MNLAITLIILLILLVIGIYIIIRNEKIFKFRNKIIDACYKSDDYFKYIKIYNTVSYNKMLYSFKPIKLESWFNEKFCNIFKKYM